jgi:hypothetical protein
MVAAKLLPNKYFSCDKPLPALHAAAPSPVQLGRLHKKAGAKGLGADGCDKKSEAQCLSPQCVWCTSAAVGGGCYTPAQAKLLPSAIFKCKTSPSATSSSAKKAKPAAATA